MSNPVRRLAAAAITALTLLAVSSGAGAYPGTISPDSLPSTTVGVSYGQTITASGPQAPYTLRVTQGSLPPGLALGSSGTLSGTATTAGTYSFTVSAIAGNGKAVISRGFAIAVAPASAPTPPPPSPPSTTTTILPSSLPGGTAGVAYGQTITVSGPAPPYTVRVTQGSLPPGLSLAAAGALAGVPTTAGTYAFTVSAFNASGSYGAFRDYSIAVAAPTALPAPSPTTTISPSSLPAGTVGAAYGQTITVSGSAPPYTVRVTQGSLPPGVTLTSAGALAGTPSTAGSYPFTVSAFNASGGYSAYRDYSIAVASATPPPSSTEPAWLADEFELGIRLPWYASGDSNQFGSVPGASGQGFRITNYATSGGPNGSSQMGAVWLGTGATLAHAWQGQDAWYRFRVYFPHDYQATTGQWNWVAEWHNDNTTMNVCGLGAVSIGLGVYTDWPVVANTYGKNPRLALRLAGGSCSAPQQTSFELPSNTLRRGHWYDVLFHFVWSTSSTGGLAEWWVDGQQQVSTRFPTLYTRPDGSPSVNSFGFYNYRLSASWTASIHYDSLRIGPSRTSVG